MNSNDNMNNTNNNQENVNVNMSYNDYVDFVNYKNSINNTSNINNSNNNKPKKFFLKSKWLIVFEIFCVLLVIGVIGYTYSFLTASVTNSVTIKGEVESLNLSLTVTKLAPTTNAGLVPQLDDYITSAVIGRNGSCVDDNNSNVCQVYKINLKNNGGSSVYVKGTLRLNAQANPNLKWAIISGTTEPTLVSSVNSHSYKILTENELYNGGESKDYYIVLWISETGMFQADKGIFNGVVKFEDQNTAETSEETIPAHDPIDNSGANYPDLIKGLIPVVYNETSSKWVKADTESSTSTYGWYNYTNKKWANAILVTEANRATYQSATAGTEITDSDILAHYVWIPRYKYKVWNKDKVVGTQSYNAKTEGIDIAFESGIDSTRTIVCNDYSYSAPSSEAGSPNETCTGANGDYYTHPAFNFGGYEVKGFWIGKYELSSETPTATDGGGSSTTLTARILPNVNSWRNNRLSNFNTVIQNMQTTNNIYGLGADKSLADSHMLTNMEWGAVAYLTNSNYGRCTGGTCTEITINNCNTYVTGIGADTVSASSSSTTCTTDANKYNGAKGVLASTTGNVYGVYDMSGGAYDYVMGNMSSTADTYTFYSSSAGFASSWYSNYSNQKYVNTYANYSSGTNQASYNRARLGDATGEVVSSTGGTGGWYNDYADFPCSSDSWFLRGGYYSDSSSAGVFLFGRGNGGAVRLCSARAALLWYNA